MGSIEIYLTESVGLVKRVCWFWFFKRIGTTTFGL